MKKIIISFFTLLSICAVGQDEVKLDSIIIKDSIDSSITIADHDSTTITSDVDTLLQDTVVSSKKENDLVIPIDPKSLEGEQIKNNQSSSVLAPILLGIALLGAILFFILKKRKKRIVDNPSNEDDSPKNLTSKQEEDEALTEVVILKEDLPLKQDDVVAHIDNKKFVLVGGSVIGKSHIQSELPCQDSHFYDYLENDWYLAVVADGAGSANMSDKGAELVAKKGVKDALKSLKIQDKDWFISGKLPSDEEWNKIAKESLRKIYNALYNLSANTEGLSIKSLACTVIFTIARHNGILIAHIGDGRAGYKNNEGDWKHMMTPFKGEEANQTIFITSDIWKEDEIDAYIESRVIRENIEAFTLLSDGCESHAFECSVIEKESGNWSDPNKPSDKFYEPLIEQIYEMKSQNTSKDEMVKSWNELLTRGTPGLENESDDKTMILAVLEKPQLSMEED